MKRPLLLIVAGAFALAAHAQTGSENAPVTIVGQKTALKPIRMSPDDFKEFKGWYTLSNGSELGLTGVGRRMYAQIDEQPVHEIVAVGTDRFVARDGKMDMHIVLHDERDASGELSYVDERYGTAPVTGAEKWVRLAVR